MDLEHSNDSRFNTRIGCIMILMWLLVLLCLWRLTIVQYLDHDKYTAQAHSQQTQRIKSAPIRGKILDRNRHEFATTTMAYDLYVSPRQLFNKRAGKRWTTNQLKVAGYSDADIKRIIDNKTTIPLELPREALWNLAEDIAAFTGTPIEKVFDIVSGNGRRTTVTRTIVTNTKQSYLMAYTRLLGLEHLLPKDKIQTAKKEVVSVMMPADTIVGKNVSQEMRDRFNEIFHQNINGDLANGIRPRYTYTTSTLSLINTNATYFLGTNHREYPQGELAGSVVGLTTANEWGDNQGVSGIEYSYNDILKGSSSSIRVRVNAGQKPIDTVTTDALKHGYGYTVVMTIDEKIQRETERALQYHVGRLRAAGGQAVVMDVKTGEVLAMASSPSFDPSRRLGTPTNRCITDAIEPGSVMKAFVYAAAIDAGKINPNTTINCGNGILPISGRKKPIIDTHAIGSVPAIKAFMESSNVGASRVFSTFSIGNTKRSTYFKEAHDALKVFGFGEKTGIDLPYEIKGIFKPYSQWNLSTQASIAMGYEVLCTPIQIVTAMASIGNEGKYMQPHVVKAILDFNGNVVQTFEPKMLRRVCKEETARTMWNMLEQVVLDGTAMSARLDNWRVGGKTGTTNKHIAGKGYDQTGTKHVGSFCGLAPIPNPKLAIYVWIDEPTTENRMHFGGLSAAPAFRDIAEACLDIMKVPQQEVPLPTTARNIYKLNVYRSTISRAIRRLLVPKSTVMNKPLYSSDTIMEIVNRLNKHEDAIPVMPGSMPDLRGMSIREAAEKLTGINKEFNITGTGVVVEQDPEPYMPIENDKTIKLQLGTPMEAELAILRGNELPGPLLQDAIGQNIALNTETESNSVNVQPVRLRIGNETVELPTTRTITPMSEQLIMQEPQESSATITATYPDKDPRANLNEQFKDFSVDWYKYDQRQLLMQQKSAPINTTKPPKATQSSAKDGNGSASSQSVEKKAKKAASDNDYPASQADKYDNPAKSPSLLRNQLPTELRRRNPTPPRGSTTQKTSFYDF